MRASFTRIIILFVAAAFTATGCGSGGGDGDGATPPIGSSTLTNTPPSSTPPNPEPEPEPAPTPPPPPAHKGLFNEVPVADWDETAVRKVLYTFAFGGQTTDAQITEWAAMAPDQAIEQMLTFGEHNLALSTPVFGDTDGLSNRNSTLRELAQFWASDSSANGVAPELRERYAITNFSGSLPYLWIRATTSRGLNPFRHKIGFWETNYHMAVSKTNVSNEPLLTYYDHILDIHQQNRPYQEVMAGAAKAAALAQQYGHRTNKFRNNECECNEDFAREYHQLLFGILGESNPDYHETVTIKNTAKAFTDMPVHWDENSGINDQVDFGMDYHPDEPLEILGHMVNGLDAAQRIDEMVARSIAHPESLDNLPVTIISHLADDNLDSRKISAIRNAWRAMPVKTLLTFLRAYATSDIFHDPTRLKFQTSVDRHVLLANLTTLSNAESYLNLYSPQHYRDDVRVFYPTHNVFGSQKSAEAAESDLVFRNNFNMVTEGLWRFRNSNGERYGVTWEKDWGAAVPRDLSGNYTVKAVAEWLWQRYLADGLKNFGPLERAHLYALLSNDRDLAFLVDENDLDRVITTDDVILDPEIVMLVDDMETQTLDLDSTDTDLRRRANRKVGMAINFIVGTPFIFAQEGA